MDLATKLRALAHHRESSFSRKMVERLKELEIRPVVFGEDREALYRFRYRCYRASGHVAPLASGMVHDEHDEAEGALLFTMWHRDEMVSSIRLNRASRANPTGMSLAAFPDVVEPLLEAGRAIVDPTRFTVCPQAKRMLPQLPYATLRLAVMATRHFKADYTFSLVRPAHGSFYRKVFKSVLIGEARTCPGVSFDVCLYSTEVVRSYPSIFSEYPFFHALPSEQRMLFGPVETSTPDPAALGPLSKEPHPRRRGTDRAASPWLTVLPTADYALASYAR